MTKELKKLRKKISKLDLKIQKHLKKRSKIVEEISQIKKKYSLPIEDKEREQEILSKMDNKYVKKVFEEIIRLSKELQK
ncbi:chorismate mutase [Candidatus Peregrinibacteria bacterium]|jgi:chorismate mutase|nr:chorismate mutase [Candidatus Peregrinibacteria bacterium]MBT4055701.1 chorismate mutase [Candidatus Peregrinibacteria bacterium]